ncbi:MAG: hypothetical protein ACTSYL_00990 [Candidatus Thorarchaeota archaeon]
MQDQTYDQDQLEREEENLELQEVSKESEYTKKFAIMAVFAALSIAIAPVATFLPRLNWGIALFDPVSLVWIAAFLVGGPYVGIATAVVGTLGLGFTDPTVVGPLFKLLATLPLIVVPSIYTYLKNGNQKGQLLSKTSVYISLMLVAYIIRILIMIPTNLALVPLFFHVNDANWIIDYTILLNTTQHIWDVLVPFVIVHKTPLFKDFRLW